MSTAFLFPGQGSQRVGMLRDVPQKYIQLCEEVTGVSLIESEHSYEDTVFIQLALLLKSVVYLEQLKKEKIRPQLVAGHSIGAFSAALACETLNIKDAVRLVYQRAYLMRRAFPTGYAMGVIVGLTRKEVSEIVEDMFDEAHPVYVSNENSPMQQTISGELFGLKQVLAAAKHRQASVAKVLKVPVPSHCVLMTPTVEQLKPLIQQIQFKQPTVPYVKNTDGRATSTAEEIRMDLLTNIAFPVQWNQMMEVLGELGMKVAIEFPPGNTLTKLIRGKFDEHSVRTINLEQYGTSDAAYLYHKWKGTL